MTFSVENLTLSEKIQAMEQLWDSLKPTATHEVVPQWHQDVLNERLKSNNFSDWSVAKDVLRATVRVTTK